VTYVNAADSDKALEHLNGATVDGRIIRVERARRSRGYTKTPGQCTVSAVTYTYSSINDLCFRLTAYDLCPSALITTTVLRPS
jgi:hypothetical protein